MQVVNSVSLSSLAFRHGVRGHVTWIVPSSFHSLGIIYTSNTLLPISCGEYHRGCLELRRREGLGGGNGGNLVRCLVLNGVLGIHDILDARNSIVERHRRGIGADGGGVHRESHVPLSRANGESESGDYWAKSCTYVIMRVGSQLCSSTNGASIGCVVGG